MSGYISKVMFMALGAFAATTGVRLMTGEKARKVYAEGTAFVLREKDRALKTYTLVKAGCEDIYADALEINAAYAKKAENALIADSAIIEDSSK